MIILSRTLFVMALFGFVSAVAFWDSLTGIILWRVSLGLAVMSLGFSLLWGESTDVLSDKPIRKVSVHSVRVTLVILSIIQGGFVLLTFAHFYFPLGSGIQFVYFFPVMLSGFLLLSLTWLTLGRYYDTYLLDHLIPYLTLVVFALSRSLSPEAVLYAKIFGGGLVVLSTFMVYKNVMCLKRSRS